MSDCQPWKPSVATDQIRGMARLPGLTLAYKMHAKERLLDRGITSSDVLYVLRFGFVILDPEPATRPGYYKYAMENKTPNSNSRDIRIIVIPDKKNSLIKLITVMWADELSTRSGTVIG